MSEEQAYHIPEQRRNPKSIVSHVQTMPGTHRMLLTIAALLFGVGAAGQVVGYVSGPPKATQDQMAKNDVQNAQNRQSFVSDPSAKSEEPVEVKPPLYQRLSPWMTKFGLAFVGGFVIGWAFRAFLKLMSMITALGLAVIMGLSYFGVLNVDLSEAKEKYQSAMTWVTDQAQKAANVVWEHIPGSASSFAGMFIGFRRK